MTLGKRFVRLFFYVTACIVLLMALLLCFMSRKISNLFTHEEEVLDLTSRVVQLMALLYLLDSL